MANQTRSTLQTLWKAVGGLFADNTSGQISESDMREFAADLVESHFNLNDDAYTGAKAIKPGINTITALKAITTVGLSVGVVISFRDTGSSDVLRVYELTAGTTAESSPNTIRPNDYAATTNEKVWKLAQVATGGGTWGSITGTVTDQTDLIAYINKYQYISAI